MGQGGHGHPFSFETLPYFCRILSQKNKKYLEWSWQVSQQPLSEFSGSALDKCILVGRRGREYSPPDPSSGFATVTCKYNLTFKVAQLDFSKANTIHAMMTLLST